MQVELIINIEVESNYELIINAVIKVAVKCIFLYRFLDLIENTSIISIILTFQRLIFEKQISFQKFTQEKRHLKGSQTISLFVKTKFFLRRD